MRDSLDALARKFDSSCFKTVPDVEIIKAEMLIATIEEAFMYWNYGDWAHYLTFLEFCEYLLPYKSRELQPLDNWRTCYWGHFNEGLDNFI